MLIPRISIIVLVLTASASFAALPPILIAKQEAAASFQKQDWAKTESSYAALSIQNPYDGAIWHNLGMARLKLKKYSEAIHAFEQSLATGRRPHECYFNIACAYAKSGNNNKSMEALAQAFRFGYTGEAQEIWNDSDLVSLRSDRRFRILIGMADPSLTEREKRWQTDIDFLDRRIREIHWRPFGVVSEKAYNEKIAALRAAVSKSDDLKMRLKIQELLSSIGDGHTIISMDILRAMHGADHGEMSGLKLLPLEFFLFESEVRIITADTSLKRLVGAKVIAVGGKPTKEVLNLLTPLVSKDNEWGGKWILMLQLSDPRILQGLGLGDTTKGVRFTLETINEKTPKEFVIPVTDHLLVPSRLEELPGTVSRTQPLNNGRKLGMMNFGKALYVKIDQVSDQHEESFADFTKRIFKTVADSKATTMIIDLRRNHGGQGHLTQELVDRLSASPEFNQQGKLYVLVGRHTFSAAMNFAAQLKLRTKALLVGEPTGSRPNFVGETTLIRLPYSGLSLSISSRFHQNGQSNDTRLWLPPDVPVTPKFDQLVRGYDEALGSVLGLVEN